MRVLIACEFSGTVREAFAKRGHDAWSCDLVPTERPGQHIVDDVRKILDDGWDLMIAHPPCTYLSHAGAKYWHAPGRAEKRQAALDFFVTLLTADIPRIAVENPNRSHARTYRKPDQVIEPWQFGHPMTKATALWLKNLPPLLYTVIHPDPVINWTQIAKFGENKARARSRTFQGIAEAMAEQWGSL